MASATNAMLPVSRNLPSPRFLDLNLGKPTLPRCLPAFWRAARRKKPSNARSRLRRASWGVRLAKAGGPRDAAPRRRPAGQSGAHDMAQITSSSQRDTEQWTALLSPAALLSGDVWQHAGAPRRELGLRRRTRQLPDHDAARPGRAHAAGAARQRIVHRYAALSEPDARVVRRGALKRQAGAGERRASQKGLHPVTTFTRRPGT